MRVKIGCQSCDSAIALKPESFAKRLRKICQAENPKALSIQFFTLKLSYPDNLLFFPTRTAKNNFLFIVSYLKQTLLRDTLLHV
jgi:hypothetical protein